MQSSLIGKIQKAKRYSEEPERINITELTSTFRGGNGDYEGFLFGERRLVLHLRVFAKLGLLLTHDCP